MYYYQHYNYYILIYVLTLTYLITIFLLIFFRLNRYIIKLRYKLFMDDLCYYSIFFLTWKI